MRDFFNIKYSAQKEHQHIVNPANMNRFHLMFFEAPLLTVKIAWNGKEALQSLK